jgi:hypothetical protein
MSTIGHLYEEELDEATRDTTKECLEWVQGTQFREQFDYEVCDDLPGLLKNSEAFLIKYVLWIKVYIHINIT